MSLGFGPLFEHQLQRVPTQAPVHSHRHGWVPVISASILLALLALPMVKQIRAQAPSATLNDDGGTAHAQGRDRLTLQVKGMSCGYWVATVKHALESIDQVTEATPELASRRIQVWARDVDNRTLEQAVETAAFQVVPLTVADRPQ